MNLHTIDTPALIIDEVKMDANIAKMSDKAKSLGVTAGKLPNARFGLLRGLPLSLRSKKPKSLLRTASPT